MNLRRLIPNKEITAELKLKEEEKLIKTLSTKLLGRIMLDEFSIKLHEYNFGTRLLDIGLDSLDFVQLIMKLEEKLHVEIPGKHSESTITIRDIIYYLIKHYSEQLLKWGNSLVENASLARLSPEFDSRFFQFKFDL